MEAMRIGVLDLLVDAPIRSPLGRLYSSYFRKQFTGVMPQTVAVWCRQMGHDVFYATYHGADDPQSILPDDLDMLCQVSEDARASGPARRAGARYRRTFPPTDPALPLLCLSCPVKECSEPKKKWHLL
jgi:hypothetical protein